MRHTSHHREHLLNVLGVFLTTVGDDLTRALDEASGATPASPAALLALHTWPHCSIRFLAGVLGLTHSGTVRLVDRLVAERLAKRGPGADGRTTALELTPAGRQLAGRLRRARHRLLEDLARELRPNERRALAVALDRVLRRGPRTRAQAQRACRLCDHSVCRGAACPVGSSVG